MGVVDMDIYTHIHMGMDMGRRGRGGEEEGGRRGR
jgi:hypothetical protein